MDTLLSLLKQNARFSDKQLAAMTGTTEAEVAEKIKSFEKQGIIVKLVTDRIGFRGGVLHKDSPGIKISRAEKRIGNLILISGLYYPHVKMSLSCDKIDHDGQQGNHPQYNG